MDSDSFWNWHPTERVYAKYFLGRGAQQVRGDAMRRRQTARNSMPSTIRRYFFRRRVVKRADAAHSDARNPEIGFFLLETGIFLLLRETQENDCGHTRATTRGVGAFDDTPER
jgi:hypothetical protein